MTGIQELEIQICDALGLSPDRVRALRIDFRAPGEFPIITATMWLRDGDRMAIPLATIKRHFLLKPIKESEPVVEVLA